MPINQFTDGITAISFGQTPTRESGQTGQVFQMTGFDTDGNQFIYDKARIVRDSYTLIFPRLPVATLNQILDFQDNKAKGSQNLFTWYDHDGAAHSVRLDADIRFREVLSGEYRVELPLVQETPWAPATDTDLLTAYASPMWILKMTINSVAYYLADSTLLIPAWSVTTKPWISSWGSIQSGISGSLGEFQASDLSVSILIDPAASPNMDDLATTWPLEDSAAELYLYDCSGNVAPSLKFTGFVADVDIPDETVVNLTIEDESTRLKTYIGRKLTLTDYPGADPDDVGKVIPIVTGFVRKVPALCLVSGWVTSLTAAITAAATTLSVSEVPNLYLVGKVLQIDDEKMTITAVSGTTLTVTRGTSLTLATDHAERSVVMEDISSPLVYIANDQPVDLIGSIFARIRGVDVDITAYCTKYTGQGGANDYTGYAGKAIITITDIVAVKNYVNLVVTEAGHSHNSAVSSSENTTLSLPTATVYSASYPKPSGYPYTPGASMYKSVTFPASGGTRSSCSYSITFTPTQTHNADVLVIINGVCKWWSNMNLYSGSPFTVTFTANAGAEANANSFDIVTVGAGLGSLINVTASTRLVYLSSTPSTSSMSGANLTGNSVSDTVIGEGLLVDIHNIKSINQVFSDILSLAGMANTTLAITGGLLNNGWSAGAEKVLNGDFNSGTYWTLYPSAAVDMLLNGNFASATGWTVGPINGAGVLGAEAVIDGGMPDPNTQWGLIYGATKGTGVININYGSANQNLGGQLTFADPGTHRVTFDISNYSSGTIAFKLPTQATALVYFSGNGTKSLDITIPTSTYSCQFWSGAGGFVGTLDNVSCKPVSYPTEFNITGGVLTGATAANSPALASQDITLTPGYSYTVSYTVVTRTAGSVHADIGGLFADSYRTTAGTFTFSFTATTTATVTAKIQAGSGGFSGSIDNFSITREAGTVAVSAGALTVKTIQDAVISTQTGITLVAGSSYRLSFDIAAITYGSAYAKMGTIYSSSTIAAMGPFTVDFTANASGTVNLQMIAGPSGFVGNIDNVSLKPLSVVPGIFNTNRSSTKYDFKTTAGLIGFCTAGAATLAQSIGGNGLVITATATDPITMLALPALQNIIQTVRIKFKRVSGSGAWDGKLYWTTASRPSYDASHYANIVQPANLAIWNTVDLDVASALGGSEWSTGTVNAIRLDFGQVSGDVYAVEFIEVIRNDGATLNGVINEYLQADVWLNRLAFQLRSWFKYLAGVPTLIVRPDSLTPTITLPACKITSDGRKVHSRKKTAREDVLNMINVLFDRDWFQSGDKAYRQVLTDSDATSIGIYGEREQPELFKFDFITSPDNAQITLDFYLANCKDRHWLHQFEVYLDQHGLDFADVVTMGFSNNQVGQIMNVGLNPGDSNSIDTVKLTVVV